MKCIRCNQKITFNQWYSEWCLDDDNLAYAREYQGHVAESQEAIRNAYHILLNEAAYSRSQP